MYWCLLFNLFNCCLLRLFLTFSGYLWTWKPLPEIFCLETWYCDKHIFRIDISPEQKQIYSILQNSKGSLSLLAFFRLAGKVDDLYKAAAKLLEDDPLDLLDALPLLLALLGLGEQALARGLHHLLADEGERLPSAAGPCHNQRSRSSGQIEYKKRQINIAKGTTDPRVEFYLPK